MPGRRGKNLRSGDLAEELGMLLLKGVAAVAEVPRPEDVGFDGVATLLREGESGLLYAEDSFYVQIKSSSVESLLYEGHEADWLIDLKLPFFVGSVDSKDARISLYTTWRLSQAILEMRYRRLTLCLSEVQERHISDEERVFNIGPPLLSWTLEDLQSAEFRRKAYEMLKTAIGIESRNIRHRAVNYIENMQWATNEYARPCGIMMTRSHYSCSEVQILESIEPYVAALTGFYMDTHDKDDSDVRALNELVLFFRRRGVWVNSNLGLGNLMRQLIDAQSKRTPPSDGA